MKELVIVIFASGPNFNFDNLQDMINSIDNNIGIDDYFYHVFTFNEHREKLNNIETDKIVMQCSFRLKSFAEEFNEAFRMYKYGCKYMIYAHDDLVIDTPNFYEKMKLTYESHSDICWVTITNHGYYKKGKLVANSARLGIYKDRYKFPKVFEAHDGDINNLDYPKAPVKIFGPMSHFNMISFEKLEKIMPCPNWSLTPLLIDEHFALKSLQQGMINVWIPDIFYQHPIRENIRNVDSLRCTNEVHKNFEKYWGIYPIYTKEDEKKLIDKIPILKNYNNNSYDWMYI